MLALTGMVVALDAYGLLVSRNVKIPKNVRKTTDALDGNTAKAVTKGYYSSAGLGACIIWTYTEDIKYFSTVKDSMLL